MNSDQQQLLSSDAWLLAAIYGASCGGEPTLARIIGVGDFINHAIFTLSEINGGVSRLSASGLIAIGQGVYKLTSSGEAITSLDPKATKGAFQQMEMIRKRIHATEWSPRIDPNAADNPSDATTYVTKSQLQKAYEEYHSTMKRKTKKNKSG